MKQRRDGKAKRWKSEEMEKRRDGKAKRRKKVNTVSAPTAENAHLSRLDPAPQIADRIVCPLAVRPKQKSFGLGII
jgi:hypothetical protein